MRRALIVNAYDSRNAGDAAIVLASCELLRSNGLDVRLATRYWRGDTAFYERHDVPVGPAVTPFPPRGHHKDTLRALSMVAGLVLSLSLALLARRSPGCARRVASATRQGGFLELLDSDIVVAAGGGYLYSATRRIDLTLLHAAACMVVAKLAGKVVTMMPQSIGPLYGRRDRWVVGRALSVVSTIVVRDAVSYEQCASLHLGGGAEIVVCPDVAFHGWSNTKGDHANGEPRVAPYRIGLVVMDWTWARGDEDTALAHYCARISGLCALLAAAGHEVVLLGHSQIPEHGQDDIKVASCIARQLADEHGVATIPLDVHGDPDTVRAVFASTDLVIGTRLHSCILALVEGVPALALGYQPKHAGTYDLLGLGDMCFDVETFEATAVGRRAEQLLDSLDATCDEVREAVADAKRTVTQVYEAILRPLG